MIKPYVLTCELRKSRVNTISTAKTSNPNLRRLYTKQANIPALSHEYCFLSVCVWPTNKDTLLAINLIEWHFLYYILYTYDSFAVGGPLVWERESGILPNKCVDRDAPWRSAPRKSFSISRAQSSDDIMYICDWAQQMLQPKVCVWTFVCDTVYTVAETLALNHVVCWNVNVMTEENG